MSCPECEAQRSQYGFTLDIGGIYMTKVPEVKSCCAVEVEVKDFDSLTVTLIYKDKEYKMKKRQFMMSSWRKYDSY